MIGFFIALGVGLGAFVVLLFVLERNAEVRKFWLSRTTTALAVGIILWKLTPVWTRWDTVFDHPFLLLSMNGGLAATLGGLFAFLAIVAVSFWQTTKIWPQEKPWRSVVPVAAGLVLAGAVTLLQPVVVPRPGSDPGGAVQTLVPDLNGMPHALVDWRGRVVVLNFWATWCPPCLAELPEFLAFTQGGSSKVVVVGVDMIATEKDGESGVAQFIKDNKMTWTQLTDASGELQKAFAVTALPTTVVLDPEGRVVDRREGAVDLFWLKTLEGRFASH